MKVPQVHYVGSKNVGGSKVNTVMQACREARAEGLNLKLPYYKLRPKDDRRYYVNYDQDIFWLPREVFSGDLGVPLYCSRCELHLDDNTPAASEPISVPCRCLSRTQHGPAAVVMNMHQLGILERDIEKAMEFFFRGHAFRKIYIAVVGGNTGKGERNVLFREPRHSPNKDFLFADTWRVVAKDKMKLLELFKTKLLQEREAFIESGMSVPSMAEISCWVIPTIEYVEAHSTRKQKHYVEISELDYTICS